MNIKQSSTRNSLLCPNCRRLVSSSVKRCPYCGINRPGSPWRRFVPSAIFADPVQLIKLIISINIGIYLLSIFISPRNAGFAFNPFNFLSPGHVSLRVLGMSGSVAILELHHWWTLVAANYLHGSLLHIAFNMIALWQLGPLVFHEYGGYRMFVIYTLGGVVGFTLSSLAGVHFTIGASGAVCSLIGAMLYYGKSRGGVYGNNIFSQIGGWAVSIFIFGLLVPGIDNWAHGGGMAAGALLGVLLGYRERKKENSMHKLLGQACVVLTLLVLIWSCINGILFLFVL